MTIVSPQHSPLLDKELADEFVFDERFKLIK